MKTEQLTRNSSIGWKWPIERCRSSSLWKGFFLGPVGLIRNSMLIGKIRLTTKPSPRENCQESQNKKERVLLSVHSLVDCCYVCSVFFSHSLMLLLMLRQPSAKALPGFPNRIAITCVISLKYDVCTFIFRFSSLLFILVLHLRARVWTSIKHIHRDQCHGREENIIEQKVSGFHGDGKRMLNPTAVARKKYFSINDTKESIPPISATAGLSQIRWERKEIVVISIRVACDSRHRITFFQHRN